MLRTNLLSPVRLPSSRPPGFPLCFCIHPLLSFAFSLSCFSNAESDCTIGISALVRPIFLVIKALIQLSPASFIFRGPPPALGLGGL